MLLWLQPAHRYLQASTFFLLQTYWLHSSVFLPLIWALPQACTSKLDLLHARTSGLFLNPKGKECRSAAQHARALSRECGFQRRKQISKYKLNKSYITFWIPKNSSENSLLCTVLQWFITHRNKKSCKRSCWHFLIFCYFCPAAGLGQLCSAQAPALGSHPALITCVCCLTRTAWGIQSKVFLQRKSYQLPSVCFHSHQTVKYL